MTVTIQERKLTKQEINILAQETRKSIHIGYIAPPVWGKFRRVFVASNGNNLLGVCVVVPLKRFLKLGPVVVLEEHQGKRIGSKLLSAVVNTLCHNNLYIGSSNVQIRKIILKLGFNEVRYLQLPLEVMRYLLGYIWQRGSLQYLQDSLAKIFRHRRGKYRYYLRVTQIP